MKAVIISVATIGAFIFLASCTSEDPAYVQSIEQWRAERIERLKGPRSWLSLIGRHPLRYGVNSVGSCDTCDVRFPEKAPAMIAQVVIDSNGVSMIPHEGTAILLDDGSQFKGDTIDMKAPPYFHVDSYYWTFLERAGKHYFRLWDTLSPARDSMHEIPAYPVDSDWKIEVEFTPADPNAMILLDDVQGERRANKLLGSITGTWRDTVFTLLALEGGPDELFIIIEDATTDIETYPGGRYLDIPMADSTGHTVIDFNLAYTPPCAFTEFATCLLPPNENRLPFAVIAGEKYLHE